MATTIRQQSIAVYVNFLEVEVSVCLSDVCRVYTSVLVVSRCVDACSNWLFWNTLVQFKKCRYVTGAFEIFSDRAKSEPGRIRCSIPLSRHSLMTAQKSLQLDTEHGYVRNLLSCVGSASNSRGQHCYVRIVARHRLYWNAYLYGTHRFTSRSRM